MIVASLVITLGSVQGARILDRINRLLVGFHFHRSVVMHRVFGVVPKVLEVDFSWVGQVAERVFDTEVDIVICMHFR